MNMDDETTRDTTGPDGAVEDAPEGRDSDGDGAGGPRADDPRGRVGRGFDRGMGAFAAFREAFEETVTEARERGDLTTDRAKELLTRAVDRARDATADARDRLDFAPRAEFEALRRRVEELERRLGVHADEASPPGADDAGEA
ncbi:MAG: hypothetical protein RLN75_01815 [Longimicrobiales bacterium]